jgi:hypothetical protein
MILDSDPLSRFPNQLGNQGRPSGPKRSLSFPNPPREPGGVRKTETPFRTGWAALIAQLVGKSGEWTMTGPWWQDNDVCLSIQWPIYRTKIMEVHQEDRRSDRKARFSEN